MFAFCVHSILEGLASGLQPTTAKVLLLLAAISCHKLVVTFCLGAELLSDNTSHASYLLSLSLYALTSGLGIAIGMFIQPSESPVIPLLQVYCRNALISNCKKL
ncbi:zinc transporter ZIP2-like, partial [Nilaparvata lugens]|uniref:zinc transporter ZIP2-like n=1 Tax=Nilaparvata lugens TaxID=108931 RepID=UPI00193CB3A3